MAAQSIRPGSGIDTVAAEVNQLIAAAAPTIVRGRVSSAGALVAGSGFTPSGGAGAYSLTFPSGTFSAAPVVVATTDSATDPTSVVVTPASATSVTVRTFDSSGTPEAHAFSFIAVGAA
jgi:hypothetical protein